MLTGLLSYVNYIIVLGCKNGIVKNYNAVHYYKTKN